MKPYSLMRAKHESDENQPDVGAFRCLDRADAAVVRRVHVAHFKSRALAAQPPGPSAERRRLCVISDSGLSGP